MIISLQAVHDDVRRRRDIRHHKAPADGALALLPYYYYYYYHYYYHYHYHYYENCHYEKLLLRQL